MEYEVEVRFHYDESVHDFSQQLKLEDEFQKVVSAFPEFSVRKKEGLKPSEFEVTLYFKAAERSPAILFSKEELGRFPKAGELRKRFNSETQEEGLSSSSHRTCRLL
jgi:hypothetical protein